MVSVCSSVYRETEQLEIFVRSVLQQASDPENVEIIIINDEGYEPTTKVLQRLSREFPQLKYFIRTKKERCEFIRKQISFYENNQLFSDEIIDDMRWIVDGYEAGLINRLWFPPGELFNLAVSKSRGDVLMISPADYLCTFDISLLYERYLGVKKLERKSFVGHFDWVDFSSLDPMPDICKILCKKVGVEDLVRNCLNQIDSNSLTVVQGQHGARLIDRESFDKVGGFDGRWFVRAWNDDCFNQKLKTILDPTYRLMDRMQFFETNAYVGALRTKDPPPINYLTQFYNPAQPENHAGFLNPIKAYLEKESNDKAKN